jgi:hypothetical protein
MILCSSQEENLEGIDLTDITDWRQWDVFTLEALLHFEKP